MGSAKGSVLVNGLGLAHQSPSVYSFALGYVISLSAATVHASGAARRTSFIHCMAKDVLNN